MQVRLEFAALHLLLTLVRVRAHDSQLVQQVPDQQARGAALMHLQPLAVHGAEVLLFQEVAEAMKAVSVATRGVHRSEQGLQTDVADQLIVHIIQVLVQVALLALVLLAALFTNPCPRQTSSAGAAGNFGFYCSHWLRELSPNLRPVSSYLLSNGARCTPRSLRLHGHS